MDNVVVIVVVIVVDKNIFIGDKNGGFVVDVFDFVGMIEKFGFLYFPCLVFCCFIEIIFWFYAKFIKHTGQKSGDSTRLRKPAFYPGKDTF